MDIFFNISKHNKYAIEFLNNLELEKYLFWNNLNIEEKSEIKDLVCKNYTFFIGTIQRILKKEDIYLNQKYNEFIAKIFVAIFIRLDYWDDSSINFYQKKRIITSTISDTIKHFNKQITNKEIDCDTGDISALIFETIEEFYVNNLNEIYTNIKERTITYLADINSSVDVEINSNFSTTRLIQKVKTIFSNINTKFEKTKNLIFFCSFIINILLLVITLPKVHLNSFYLTFLSIFLIILSIIGFELLNLKKKQKKIQNQLNNIDLMYNDKDLYERIGVDVLCVHCAANLIPFFDPDKDNEALPAIADLRIKTFDEKGFLIPNCRILDDSRLNDYEFAIYIRDKLVLKTEMYPQKLCIWKEDIDNLDESNPKLITTNYGNKQLIWGSKKVFEELGYEKFHKPSTFYKVALYTEIKKHIRQIFSLRDVLKQLVILENYSYDITEELLNKYSIHDCALIFTLILEKDGSLKDLAYLTKLILKYSKETDDFEFLAHLVVNELNFDKQKEEIND